MNCKLVLFLLAFNLIYLSFFHTGECFPFLRRGRNHRRNEMMALPDRPVAMHTGSIQPRQTPISTLFSGPLALATFLFALPLLPSLVMAPLALAGIPPALNALSSVVSSFTSGKPFNSVLSAVFSDPLHASASTSSGSTTSGDTAKPSGSSSNSFVQLDALKNIARVFRMAISRRHMTPLKIPSPPENALVPDKVQDELEELASTALNTTLEAVNATTPVAEMEKSIRAMDAVYSSIREVYSVIRNGLRRYEITDSDCQSRIVCEIHQKIISRNKMLKSFSLNAIDLLSLEKHVDTWSSLNEKSRRTVKFYIKAAKIGFADKDCNKEFGTCPTLSLKNTKNLVLTNLMFNRQLFAKV